MINYLLEILAQLRVWHWQSLSRAQHDAYGEATERLEQLIDRFVEAHTARHGFAEISDVPLTLIGLEHQEKLTRLDYYQSWITKSLCADLDPLDNADLFSLRDEMIETFNLLRYHRRMT